MKNIKIGESVPKRGSKLMQLIANGLLKIKGWEIKGEIPDIEKFIIVVAPHTSNWDFILGLLTLFSIRIEIHWMGKHTIFKKPFGGLMKWLGGIPINRTSASGVVNEIVAAFKERDKLIISIAPEGTRKKVNKWKMGFYFIAHKAEVPIVIATIDYEKRIIGFGPTIELTDNRDKDIKNIMDCFKDIIPRHLESF